MGYNVMLTGSDFKVEKDKLDALFEALKELNKRDDLKTGGAYSGGKQIEIYFAWMSADYDKTSRDAAHIFEQLGFTVETDAEGNLTLEAYDSKAGAEDDFLAAAAPFVTPGSYLEWEGEDGERWRQEFDGEGIRHRTGYTAWEE